MHITVQNISDGGIHQPDARWVSWNCNLGNMLRVKVKGSGNVFFDISNANFTSPVPVQLESFGIE